MQSSPQWYLLPSVWPGADLGVQTVSPQVTWSHPPGSRLPLLSARLAVNFPAEERHRPSAGTKLYCLVTEAHSCEQLAQGCYLEADRPRFEPAIFRIASERSNVKPHRPLDLNQINTLTQFVYSTQALSASYYISTVCDFNISLHSGLLPSDSKYAVVTPVLKKGSPSDPANYRLISFTCIACKLLHCVSKKRPTFKLSLTLSNLNRFLKFLHCWKAYEICYNSHMTIPTLP